MVRKEKRQASVFAFDVDPDVKEGPFCQQVEPRAASHRKLELYVLPATVVDRELEAPACQ